MTDGFAPRRSMILRVDVGIDPYNEKTLHDGRMGQNQYPHLPLALHFFVCYNEKKDFKKEGAVSMNLLNLLAISPATGDNSPQRNIVVYIILGVAAVSAIVLGMWKGKK